MLLKYLNSSHDNKYFLNALKEVIEKILSSNLRKVRKVAGPLGFEPRTFPLKEMSRSRYSHVGKLNAKF